MHIRIDEHGCLSIETKDGHHHFFLTTEEIKKLFEECDNYIDLT